MPHAAFIRAATQTLVDHVDELTALDQAIGDGDHGLNMKRGALAIQARLPELEAKSLNDALKTMGMTCMSTIGGSSGPVFGTLLVTLAKDLPPAPGPADLARALGTSITALTRLGKAEVGQKTLLDVLAESLDGFAAAHGDIVSLGEERLFVRRRTTQPGKVALISGGGSGHEPLHAGFVGRGMLDAACPGHVFTSPTPNQMLAAAQAVETGAGVLFIVKNYSGDMMNFQLAADMLDRGHATVIVSDDVAVENSTYTTGRRGVAGTLVNGFGGTPVLELYVMVHAVRKLLADAGVKVVRYLTGAYVTSLDMAGCSVTITAVDDNTLALWDAPVHTAALRWGM